MRMLAKRKRSIKNRPSTRRQLKAESLERRHLLAATLQPATMESIAQKICDPEADTNHSAFVDSVEVAQQTRFYSIVYTETNHPPGTTHDRGKLFGEDDCDVVPNDPTPPEVAQTEFVSTEIRTTIEKVDVPSNEVEQMRVRINGGAEFSTDRLAFSRHIQSDPTATPDARQFLVIASDSFIRTNTLPSVLAADGTPADDNFGLSVGLATTEEIRDAEIRRLGQIDLLTIDTRQGLPRIEITFLDGGSAILDVVTVTPEETRIDVTLNRPTTERLVVIGSNPETTDRLQRDDIISDFDYTLIETVGHNGRLFAAPAHELGDALASVDDVARAAFNQVLKSQHNPRDGTLAILLGKEIPSDGFGDVSLVEAENGSFERINDEKILRPTASHDGEIPEETSVLLMGGSLNGSIRNIQNGSNIAFARYSLDDESTTATLALTDSEDQTLLLESTRMPGLATAQAWNFHKVAISDEFISNQATLDYALTTTKGEIDTLGMIHLGNELGSSKYDVNTSGMETALDALLIINHIERNGGTDHAAPLGARMNVSQFDSTISALDALLVINYLATTQQENEREGERIANLAPIGSPNSDDNVVRAEFPAVFPFGGLRNDRKSALVPTLHPREHADDRKEKLAAREERNTESDQPTGLARPMDELKSWSFLCKGRKLSQE